jgi:hypothetical protein
MMIYVEEAERNRMQALTFLRLSARIDAVAGRVQSQMAVTALQKSMGVVSAEIERAMQSLNPAAISQAMDKFESQFVNLDTATATMDSAISSVTASSVPAEEVKRRMDILKAQQGLSAANSMQGTTVGSNSIAAAAPGGVANAPTPVAAGGSMPPPAANNGGAAGGGGGGAAGGGGGGAVSGKAAAAAMQARLDALKNKK